MWKDGREPAVKCTAKTTAGYPCQRPPIKGGSVCRTHGGAAPQVRRQAAIRILEASDKAAAKLVSLMQDSKVPYNVQLAAARDLLDRASLAGTHHIEVEVVPKRTWDDFIDDALIDVEFSEVQDAEIIEDGHAIEAREQARDLRMEELKREALAPRSDKPEPDVEPFAPEPERTGEDALTRDQLILSRERNISRGSRADRRG